MKKIYLVILVAVLILGVLIFQNIEREIKEVCYESNCFKVEIPKNEQEKMQGLMFRENLPKESGMLFIFDKEDKHGFWMKNTLIPLDIIWINEEKKVVHIAEAIPCEQESCPIYFPSENAKYVLEINSGISKQIDLNVGDQLFFR